MKNKLVMIAVAAALGAGASFQAAAQPKPDQLVKQRQSAMALIGWYFGPVGAMMRGDRPFDAAIVRRNTEYLDVLVKLPGEGFHPSTKDEKTRARPEVWTDKPKFDKAMENMQVEMAKLKQVAASGDQGAIKTQFGAVGKSCANCHDDFRTKQ